MDLHTILLHIITVGFISIMVEAKYCPIEIDGDVKYYICPRNEICCTFGCCISSNFHFYQLWYYWLMVILMFLLCSGGTWWYRYWLQEGHYPPHPPPPHRALPRRPPVANPSTRVVYHPDRNHVVLHQIWKPPRCGRMNFAARVTPPPSYSLVQNSTTTLDQSGSSGVVNVVPTQVAKLKPSPYYQLYGPPPSYDSVVSETNALRQNDNQLMSVGSERSVLNACATQFDSHTNQHVAHSSTSSQPTSIFRSQHPDCDDDTMALPK